MDLSTGLYRLVITKQISWDKVAAPPRASYLFLTSGRPRPFRYKINIRVAERQQVPYVRKRNIILTRQYYQEFFLAIWKSPRNLVPRSPFSIFDNDGLSPGFYFTIRVAVQNTYFPCELLKIVNLYKRIRFSTSCKNFLEKTLREILRFFRKHLRISLYRNSYIIAFFCFPCFWFLNYLLCALILTERLFG